MDHLTLEQVALELVKLEKNKPSPGQPQDTIRLFETYLEKVYKARDNYVNNTRSS